MEVTRRQLETLAYSLGASLRFPDGRHPCVAAEAPTGQVWAAGMQHELVEEAYGLPRARTNLAERMRYGLMACDDPDCEWCSDESESSH